MGDGSERNVPPRAQAAHRRSQYPLPIRHAFRYFHRVPGPAQKEELHRLSRIIEKDIDQAANDADTAGQQQVERFLAEPQFLADPQRSPPMPAKVLAQVVQDLSVPEKQHQLILRRKPVLTSAKLKGAKWSTS